MQTATPFTALGAGNGFPFCPSKIDVSGYDYWTTLGGFKKIDGGSPTQSQISESLRVAMALFWNLDGWTGRLYYEDTGPFPSLGEITSLSIKDDDWTRGEDNFTATKRTGTEEDDPEFDPKDRVCYRSFYAVKYLFTYSGANQVDGISIGSSTKGFVRMYNGDTSDEGNFVGYGFQSIVIRFGLYDYLSIELSSYDDGTPASSTQKYEDISYTEIPTNIAGITIPCVGTFKQYVQGGGRDIPDDFDTYSWEDLTFSRSAIYEYGENGETGTKSYEFRIDSLDFYTY